MDKDKLLKTFTESEEKSYAPFHKKYISKKIAVLITLLCAFAGIINLYSVNTCECKVHCPEKNGAGDTWICPQCGNESYDWQISCLNCGYWR